LPPQQSLRGSAKTFSYKRFACFPQYFNNGKTSVIFREINRRTAFRGSLTSRAWRPMTLKPTAFTWRRQKFYRQKLPGKAELISCRLAAAAQDCVKKIELSKLLCWLLAGFSEGKSPYGYNFCRAAHTEISIVLHMTRSGSGQAHAKALQAGTKDHIES